MQKSKSINNTSNVNSKQYFIILSGLILFALFHFLCIGLTVYYTIQASQIPEQQPIVIYNRKHVTFSFAWDDYLPMRFRSVQFQRDYSFLEDVTEDDEDDSGRHVQVLTLTRAPQLNLTLSDPFVMRGKFVLNSEPLNRNYASYSYMVNPATTLNITQLLTSPDTEIQYALIIGDDNYMKWCNSRRSDYVYSTGNMKSNQVISLSLQFGTSQHVKPGFTRISIDTSEMLYIVYYTKTASDRTYYNGDYQYSFDLTRYDPQPDTVTSICNLTTTSVCEVKGKSNVLIVGSGQTDTTLTTLLVYQYRLSYAKIWTWTGLLICILVIVDLVALVLVARRWLKKRLFKSSNDHLILDTSYSYGSVPSSYRS